MANHFEEYEAATKEQAKKNYADYTRHILTREAKAALAKGKIWEQLKDGVWCLRTKFYPMFYLYFYKRPNAITGDDVVFASLAHYKVKEKV